MKTFALILSLIISTSSFSNSIKNEEDKKLENVKEVNTQVENLEKQSSYNEELDCTVSFSGELSVKVVTLKYECSSTQADCTKATQDAFNCLTTVYSKVRSLILQSM